MTVAGLLLLPAADVHVPVYADPTEPVTRLELADEGVSAVVAQELPLLGADRAGEGGADWRLGIAGGAWMTFEPGGELTFRLLTLDGRFSVPLDLRTGPWSLRLEWGHESSHFADGVRYLDERPEAAGIWSREWLEVQAAVDVGGLHPYAGLRGIVHAVDLGPGAEVQAGLLAEAPWGVAPFAGADLTAASDADWRPALTGLAGARLHGPGRRSVRLGLSFRAGPTRAGPVAARPETRVGIAMVVTPVVPPAR